MTEVQGYLEVRVSFLLHSGCIDLTVTGPTGETEMSLRSGTVRGGSVLGGHEIPVPGQHGYTVDGKRTGPGTTDTDETLGTGVVETDGVSLSSGTRSTEVGKVHTRDPTL